MTYGFIGLGLIGGSIAKALKAGEPDCQIYAYMPSREMLEEARADGTVDRILTGTEPCLADCDAVFLCAPVETNSSYLAALRDILTADTLITDVGSSKQSIEREVLRLGLGAQFVGGHPMAGSEKSGYIYSDALLLENIFYLLCPTAETRPEMRKRMEALVHRMLANPYVIDAATHDRAVATISHLPHLIAAALVNLVKDTDNEAHTMRSQPAALRTSPALRVLHPSCGSRFFLPTGTLCSPSLTATWMRSRESALPCRTTTCKQFTSSF